MQSADRLAIAAPGQCRILFSEYRNYGWWESLFVRQEGASWFDKLVLRQARLFSCSARFSQQRKRRRVRGRFQLAQAACASSAGPDCSGFPTNSGNGGWRYDATPLKGKHDARPSLPGVKAFLKRRDCRRP